MTLAELFTIHVNLHAMEFPLIFGEQTSWKSQKSMKFTALEERAPYGIPYMENRLQKKSFAIC